MDIVEYIKKSNSGKAADPQPQKPLSPQDTLRKYAGYTEEQLMSELFRHGSLSGGKVTAKELDDFYAKVSSYLRPEQKERMKELIIGLKNS